MKIKKVVVDASYVLSMLFPDESNHVKNPGRMCAPNLLLYEVVNALNMGVRRKRITVHVAKELLKEYLSWGIEYREIEPAEVLALAHHNSLTVYDASYAWLSKREKSPLLTLDSKLEAASA